MNYPKALSDCRIGFIGSGNMAQALATGFIKSGQISAKQMSASAPSDRNLTKFKDLGCFVTNNNNNIFSHLSGKADQKCFKILFLCVKPFVFKSFQCSPRSGFKSFIDINKLIADSEPLLVISVMAGIPISQLYALEYTDDFSEDMDSLNANIRYASIMPNTATAVCAGICGISVETSRLSDEESQQLKHFLNELLCPIALCEFVADSQLSAVTGLGGSGIAFVYSLIHAMSDGGVKMGLPRSVANNIAAQTVLGAALMVQNTDKNPITLRDEVTSPGGTTIHGLHALEKGSFSGVIMDAIESATKRADEFRK